MVEFIGGSRKRLRSPARHFFQYLKLGFVIPDHDLDGIGWFRSIVGEQPPGPVASAPKPTWRRQSELRHIFLDRLDLLSRAARSVQVMHRAHVDPCAVRSQ